VEKLAEFCILCCATKVVVCYLLNKRVATFSIVTYCQQIGEDSTLVIPQNILGRIPHSVFRIPQCILTRPVTARALSNFSPRRGLVILIPVQFHLVLQLIQ